MVSRHLAFPRQLSLGYAATHLVRLIVRPLFGLLALLGLAGVVSGALTIIRGAGNVSFSHEHYGGPGPIIGGLLLLSVSLYLLSIWPRIESRTRTVHNI